MKKVAVVKSGEIKLNDLIKILKESRESDKCGAIVFFIGIVRGYSVDGKKLTKLVYDSETETAEKTMMKIRNEIMGKYPQVKELIIYHIVDELEVGEETIFIGSIAEHRKEAFDSAREALERVKEEVPIWKKEVSIEGEHWILGDDIVKV